MIEVILQAERALTAGMVDQAERLYSQALQHDPRNSIAVVGLARVALERGDDRAAYLLARRALDVDGENVAARRLVARLSEVMAYRGERLPDEPATVVPSPEAAVAATRLAAGAAPAPDLQPKRGLLARLRGRR